MASYTASQSLTLGLSVRVNVYGYELELSSKGKVVAGVRNCARSYGILVSVIS